MTSPISNLIYPPYITPPPSSPSPNLSFTSTSAFDLDDDPLLIVYWLLNISGSTIGLLSNALLIRTICRTSGRPIQPYSYLFLVSAVFDELFSFVEMVTQHQLVIRNGVMFILPHGMELYSSPSIFWVFIIPHGFVAYHGLYILGAQFKYRHDLITKTNTTWHSLAQALCLTVPCGLYSGASLTYAILQSKQRGDDFYKKLMDGPWFNEHARRYFMYACDIRDLGGKLLFYGSLIISMFWFSACIYYSLRTYLHVHKQKNDEVSERTRELQRQYDKSLILQTINAVLFAVIPITTICAAVIFRLKWEFLGIGGMSPLCWLPAANALTTLYVVKPYRAYVLSFFRLKSRPNRVSNVMTIPGTILTHKVQDRSTTQNNNSSDHAV